MIMDNSLKIIFMGTSGNVVQILSSILDNGHQVISVYTQPDRRAGRGRKPVSSAVKIFAKNSGLPISQPVSLLRDPEAKSSLMDLEPDLIVVASYGQILPAEVVNEPPLGCLNIHPSLLPKYRGASPVATAILEGDSHTGVTLMKLDSGMDTGPILAQRKTEIGSEETTDTLTTRLLSIGSELLIESLIPWARGEMTATDQDEKLATHTTKMSKKDGYINWKQPADRIDRHIRANHSWPGAYTNWQNKTLKILGCSIINTPHNSNIAAGRVVSLGKGRFGVGTGSMILELTQVQLEGRRTINGSEFLNGHPDILTGHLGHHIDT